ncbi:MAG: flagellar type III secretion system protein FlhB [Pseudomonadota bacterium]
MAEEQNDDQEKSHEATPQRIRKAREKGDVASSTEANTAAAYVGLMLALLALGGWTVSTAGARLKAFLARPDMFIGTHAGGNNGVGSAFAGDAIMSAVLSVIVSFLPMILLPATFVILSMTAQQAIVFAPSKIEIKWSKISIVSNAQQKFGPKGLAEFVRSLLKLSLIIAISSLAGFFFFERLPGYARLDTVLIGRELFQVGIVFIGLFTGAAILVGAIDLPWRRAEHAKRLKMSYKELQDETKETEGDPYLKATRRDRARAVAQMQQMQEVPNADVVLVNPTHYAVALKWDRESGRAPVCVAKGVDEVAKRIREIATESGVPIHRDPPTTRSLYELVEVGDEIEREHYAAVAAAIHFAEEMRKKAREFSWRRS